MSMDPIIDIKNTDAIYSDDMWRPLFDSLNETYDSDNEDVVVTRINNDDPVIVSRNVVEPTLVLLSRFSPLKILQIQIFYNVLVPL